MVITLCGSSRFVGIMAICAWLMEKNEHAITMGLHLLPRWYCKDVDDHVAEDEGVAAEMDYLHLQKIDMSDAIFVVNYQNYIGESTRNEVIHAKHTETDIRWFTHDPIGAEVMKIIEAAEFVRAAEKGE